MQRIFDPNNVQTELRRQTFADTPHTPKSLQAHPRILRILPRAKLLPKLIILSSCFQKRVSSAARKLVKSITLYARHRASKLPCPCPSSTNFHSRFCSFVVAKRNFFLCEAPKNTIKVHSIVDEREANTNRPSFCCCARDLDRDIDSENYTFPFHSNYGTMLFLPILILKFSLWENCLDCTRIAVER